MRFTFLLFHPNHCMLESVMNKHMEHPEFDCVFVCRQDDVVMGTLTVRENLRFSAALRLPKSIKQKDKDEKVERLIQELGLSKVADSRVTIRTVLHKHRDHF